MQDAPTTNALEVRDLRLGYRVRGTVREVVHSVDFTVPFGRSFGLIGESGSGKSTIAASLVAYLPPESVVLGGSVLVDGIDVLSASRGALRHMRGNTIGMVAQEASSALNPSMKLGAQVVEAIRAKRSITEDEARSEALSYLTRVQLRDPEGVMDRYPHEISGGQQQRVFIAMTLAAHPRVVIFDEPTTGLDAAVQSEVLDLIEDLRASIGLTSIFISHDLGVVGRMCDDVGVMFEGSMVETGPVAELFTNPQHPYTRALMACTPRLDSHKTLRPLSPISSDVIRLTRLQIAAAAADEEPPAAPVPATSAAAPVGVTAPRPAPPRERMTDRAPLLTVSGLHKSYGHRRVLEDVSFQIRPGEILGLLGESGSGKSTLIRTLAGLTQADAGSIHWSGAPLEPKVSRRKRDVLEAIQMVYQDPQGTLNPRIAVGPALARAAKKLHGTRTPLELLDAVDLDQNYAYVLPGSLSGGQKQRVAIARAFAGTPRLVLADEPVSALDVSVQAGVLNLLESLQREKDVSILFISHDTRVVRYLTDRVIVLEHGRIVEEGDTEAVFSDPQHEYTRRLLAAAEATGIDAIEDPVEGQGAA